jgi:hypothetical protein
VITRYYSALFSNKENSIRAYVDKLEDNLFSLFENLPKGICLVDKNDPANKYLINFENDTNLSHEEYTLLSSVFQQYYHLENDTYDVYFVGAKNNFIRFSDYTENNVGGFKLLRSILFLDFTNSLEFMHNFFAFYTIDNAPMFKALPSFEKKDTLMSMKEKAQNELDILSNEYDRVKMDLTNQISAMDSMYKVLSDLEVGLKLHNATGVITKPKAQENIALYHLKVKKISSILSRIDSHKGKLINFVNYVIQNPDRTESDSVKKKMCDAIILKREKLKLKLVNTQNSYLRELNTIAVDKINTEIDDSPKEDVGAKITELRHKLSSIDAKKSELGSNLSNLRDRINSLNLQILDIDNRLVSDFKPVDVDKLAYDNIIALDTPATIAEKLTRFTSAFFMNLNSEGYLKVAGRREFLKKLNPYLKLKSISTYPSDKTGDFICVG